MGDLVTLFPRTNPLSTTTGANLTVNPQSEISPGVEFVASASLPENSTSMVKAPREPLLVAASTRVGELTSPFVTRLLQGRLAQAGSEVVHMTQNLRILLRNGPIEVRIRQLASAFARETSAPKMQNLIEQMAALGEEGVQHLARIYTASVMRAAQSDILGELRRKTLVNVLTRVVKDQFKSFVAPEKILDQMLMVQLISERPLELQLIAECLIACGVSGEAYLKSIFQSGGIVVDEKGERNFDRFTISAELYLDQLDFDLDAEKSDISTGTKRNFKLTLECLWSLYKHAVDAALRSRALELIFELRCRG